MRNKLKKPLKKRQNSEYWIYGHHAVVAALKNEKREKYEIVFTTEAKKKLEKEINLQELKLIKKIKNRDEIENLLGEKSNHQGICLKANKIANQELKELISNIKSDNALIVLLDQLEDPQNVGAIFRSALAFNLNGVIMTENNSVNENAFLTKAASGGIDKLPFAKIKNISSSIKVLKDSGYWIYGLDVDTSKTIDQINYPKKVVIVLGSEHRGIRKITSSLCDEIVKIEMNDAIESLNVSNTAAIAFFHISKSMIN